MEIFVEFKVFVFVDLLDVEGDCIIDIFIGNDYYVWIIVGNIKKL